MEPPVDDSTDVEPQVPRRWSAPATAAFVACVPVLALYPAVLMPALVGNSIGRLPFPVRALPALLYVLPIALVIAGVVVFLRDEARLPGMSPRGRAACVIAAMLGSIPGGLFYEGSRTSAAFEYPWLATVTVPAVPMALAGALIVASSRRLRADVALMVFACAASMAWSFAASGNLDRS